MTTNDFNLLNGLLGVANTSETHKLSDDELREWKNRIVVDIIQNCRDSLKDDARYIVHSDLLARLAISVVAIVVSGNVAQDVGQAGAIALALANGGLLWSFFGRNS